MNQPFRTVTVQLLDKEYTIGCPDGAEAELLASADFLDGKMREIREQGKLLGLERIAVMAALNISHELMKSREHSRDDIEGHLKHLAAKIDTALQQSDNTEKTVSQALSPTHNEGV